MEIQELKQKIIIMKESYDDLVSYLNTNYKFVKVLFVTTKELYKKFRTMLEPIFKGDYNISLVELPEFACLEDIYFKDLSRYIQEDIKLIISFGGGGLTDLIKCLANHENLPYLVMPSAMSAGGYVNDYIINFKENVMSCTKVNLPELCYVNTKQVIKCSVKTFANCYAEIFSSFSIILEKAFSYGIYDDKTNLSYLYEIERLAKNCLILESSALATAFGKLEIFYNYLKINLLTNLIGDSMLLPSVKMSQWIRIFTKNKISCGESKLVCYLFLSKLYTKLFQVKYINENWVFNLEKRLNILNYYNLKLSHFQKLVYTDKESENYIFRFHSLKEYFYATTKNYEKLLQNAFIKFKNLHLDKAVFINRNVNGSAVKLSIYLSAEGENSILTFMRNYGFLDKLIS